jgi:hypothetical protein
MPESYSWRKYKRQAPYDVTDIVFISGVDSVMSIECISCFGEQTLADACVLYCNLSMNVGLPTSASTLCDGSLDAFTWKFTSSGEYATRPSYLACFAGRMALPAAAEVWHSFAPAKHLLFWLARDSRALLDGGQAAETGAA